MQEVLSDPEASVSLLDFAAHHLAAGCQEVAWALLSNSTLPAELRELIQSNEADVELLQVIQKQPVAEPLGNQAANSQRKTLLQKINRMSVPEKINAALKGSREERTVLVRDANKVVARTVLLSPQLTDQEFQSIATMKNVSEEVLRSKAFKLVKQKEYAQRL